MHRKFILLANLFIFYIAAIMERHTRACYYLSRMLILIVISFALGLEPKEPVIVINTKARYSKCQEEKLVEVGSSLHLPCQKDENSGKFHWIKDDMRITDGNAVMGNLDLEIENKYLYDYNLVIKKAKEDTAGNYQCTSQTTTKILKNYNVKIKRKARILETNSSVMVSEFSTFRIFCKATGPPEPTIQWFMVGPETRKPIGVYGSVLEVKDVSRYCESKYLCSAFNELNHDKPAEKIIEVKIEYKPDIFIDMYSDNDCNSKANLMTSIPPSKSDKKIFVEEGKKRTLVFSVSANPHEVIRLIVADAENKTVIALTEGHLEKTNEYEDMEVGECTPLYKNERRIKMFLITSNNHFQKYSVMAENRIGVTTISFELKKV